MADKKYIHKETFFQDYSDEPMIPSHWVVQFYTKGDSFPVAAYFETHAEALEFERELNNES